MQTRCRGARLLLLAGLASALGCATVAPEPFVDDAASAVELADQGGARRYAPTEMGLAVDQLRQAQKAAQNRSEWIEARRLAEKATADAELALELSRAEQLRISLEQLRRSIDEAAK